MVSLSRSGDSKPISRQGLIEHGLGLPCGVLPEYKDISSDDILTGEFDESSKFNGAMFSRRPRVDGDRPFELMLNAFVMRLQIVRKKGISKKKLDSIETIDNRSISNASEETKNFEIKTMVSFIRSFLLCLVM